MLFDNFSPCLLLSPVVFFLLRAQLVACNTSNYDYVQPNLPNLQRFIPMMSANSYAQELQNTNKYDILRSSNGNEISSGSVAIDKESLARLEQLIKTLIRTYMKLFMIDSQRTVETTLLSATNLNNNSNNKNGEISSQYQLGVPNDNSRDVNTVGIGRGPITRSSTPSALNINQKQDYTAQPTSGTIFSRLNPQQMAGRLESILPFGLGTNDSASGTIFRQSPQTVGQLESILPFGYFGLNGGGGSGGEGESSRGGNTNSGQVMLSMPPQNQQQTLQTQNFHIPVLMDHSDALMQSQPMKISIPSGSDFQFSAAKPSQSTAATTTTAPKSRQIPAMLYVTTKDGLPTVEGVKIDNKISQIAN